MTTVPKVSVIVPVYNAQNTIKDCLDSIISSNYPRNSFEIIVIDNSSTDNTPNLLREYRDKIIIKKETQRGASAARNNGIRSSTYDIIAFTDSDCVLDNNWLTEITKPLEDNDVGIVGGKILAWGPGNYIERFGETIHDHEKAINEYKPPYAITMNWASRKSVLVEVGLFNTELIRGQDVDMSFKIIQSGYRIVYNPNALVFHKNERNLSGLFNEGYTHGLWSVKLIRYHKEFLEQYGYKRFNINSYRRLFYSLASYLRGKNSEYSLCDFIFNLGKKFGKLHGSMVNSYLDL